MAQTETKTLVVKEMSAGERRIYLCLFCEFNCKDVLLFNQHLLDKHNSNSSTDSAREVIVNANSSSGGERPISSRGDSASAGAGGGGGGGGGFACSESECAFVGKSFVALRTHLINKHKSRQFSRFNKRRGVKTSNKRSGSRSGSGRSDNNNSNNSSLFSCTQSDCEYVGRNGHGLRVHLMRRHDIRVIDNQCRTTKGEGEDRTAGGEEEREMRGSYSCLERACLYSGENALGLRVHLKRKHGIQVNTKDLEEEQEVGVEFGCSLCPFVGKNAIALRTHTINGHKKNRKWRNKSLVFESKKKKNNRREGADVSRSATRRRPALLRNAEEEEEVRRASEEGRAKADPVHRCQFPKCELSFASSLDLRQHIQSAHKKPLLLKQTSSTSAQNPLKCYFPSCPVVPQTSLELRQHILSVHERQHQKQKRAAEEEEAAEEEGRRRREAFPVFRCLYPNCYFTGSLTLKGLRIHVKRNHKKRIQDFGRQVQIKPHRTPLPPPPPPNASKLAQPTAPTKSPRAIIQTSLIYAPNQSSSSSSSAMTGRGLVLFRCSHPFCSYSVQNLIELRKHIESKH